MYNSLLAKILNLKRNKDRSQNGFDKFYSHDKNHLDMTNINYTYDHSFSNFLNEEVVTGIVRLHCRST